MKTLRIPKTDSIQKLAEFWDTHDLTDFQDELEEVTEPVFVRGKPIRVQLRSSEAAAVQEIARFEGVSQEELIRSWVLQKLARRKSTGTTKRRK